MGPVRTPQNEAAHGGVCIVDTCSCGAERRTNVNGRHVEPGEWLAAPASVEVAPAPDGGWAVHVCDDDGGARPIALLLDRADALAYAALQAHALGVRVREVAP